MIEPLGNGPFGVARGAIAHSFSVNRAGGITTTLGGNNAVIPWTALEWQTDDYWRASDSTKIIIPKGLAGLYLFRGGGKGAAGGSGDGATDVRPLLNGVEAPSFQRGAHGFDASGPATNNYPLNWDFVMVLRDGESVEIRYYTSNGQTQANFWWKGVLLGPMPRNGISSSTGSG